MEKFEESLEVYYRWPIRSRITSENSEFMVKNHPDGFQEVVFATEENREHAKKLVLRIMSKRKRYTQNRQGD